MTQNISPKMSGLEVQETTEYYKWLIRVEQAEFEKELLDIVSNPFHHPKLIRSIPPCKTSCNNI